jgi:hypothetical protein
MVEQCLEALDWDGGEGRRLRKLTTARLDLTAWEEEERADMWGPHVSDREDKRCNGGMHEPKRKSPFGECAKASRVGWAEWGDGGLRVKVGRLGQTLGGDSKEN